MQHPVDALVTGFTRSPELLSKSLDPLRRLKQEGVVRDIHYVTWDSAEIDSHVAPLQDMPEIRQSRVRQPDVSGNPTQRGVAYQIENLKAALALVPDDAWVLKWRPDFVARHAFLREKIIAFPRNAAMPARQCLGVTMPPPVFQHKIWIPWADSNSPFFYEDAVFMGTRRDIEKLALPLTAMDKENLGHPHCGAYAHILRYARPFLSGYPLLRNYLRNIRYFRHDIDYRLKAVPFILDDGFFWHLLIAHAWILHSQFHVDVGAPGDLAFYANNVNKSADWNDFSTLATSTPYDDAENWRINTKAGLAIHSLSRVFGRLMDDSWQQALFTADLPDLPRDTLIALMANIAGCADGRLDGIEAEFYRGLERLHSDFHAPAPAG